jgi:glycosyltransferase involved in cell wall biosynthesis
MHIGYIMMTGSPTFSGGVAQAVYARAQYLIQRGHRVSVICKGNRRFYKPQVIDGIHVYPGFIIHAGTNRIQMHPLLPLVLRRQLLKCHADHKLDVLEMCDGVTVFAAREVCKKRGIPTTFAVHGSSFINPTKRPEWVRNYYKRSEREAALFADLCLPVSQFMQDVHERHGLPPAKYRVVRNAIDPKLYELGERKRIHEEGPLRLVCVGRLADTKRLDIGIRAVAEAAKHVDLRLDLYGEGPEEAALRELAAQEGAGEVVHFRGQFDHRDALFEELLQADALLFPSELESSGLALLEAMAVGLTCITSDIPTNREALGDDGFIVRAGDVAEFAQAIRKVATERAILAEQFPKMKARAAVYLPEVCFRDLPEIYRQVAAR